MTRKIIPRRKDGSYAHGLEGIDNFALEVVKKLLDKYPDVDYYDLELHFNAAFEFQYMWERMYGSHKISSEDEREEIT